MEALKEGGFTFDPKRGRLRSSGVAVGGARSFEFMTSLDDFKSSGAKIIRDYAKKHAKELAKPKCERGFVGVWWKYIS